MLPFFNRRDIAEPTQQKPRRLSLKLKAQLCAMALCLTAVGGSQLYLTVFDAGRTSAQAGGTYEEGFAAGMTRADDEAFDSYVQVAKAMQEQKHATQVQAKTHKPAKHAPSYNESVFAALSSKHR